MKRPQIVTVNVGATMAPDPTPRGPLWAIVHWPWTGDLSAIEADVAKELGITPAKILMKCGLYATLDDCNRVCAGMKDRLPSVEFVACPV